MAGGRPGKGHVLISKKANYTFTGMCDDGGDVAILQVATR